MCDQCTTRGREVDALFGTQQETEGGREMHAAVRNLSPRLPELLRPYHASAVTAAVAAIHANEARKCP